MSTEETSQKKSRVFKFRAWDMRKKKMVPLWNIGWKAWDGPDGGINEYIVEDDGTYSADETNIILMQYTGLKDSKGIEIYDGDIVECKYPGNWEIYWANKADNGCQMSCYKARRYDNPVNCTIYTMGAMTIIGNIHENPELIKAK